MKVLLALVLSLLCLTFAAPAAAECAWVLWTSTTVGGTAGPVTELSPSSAFPVQAECEAEAAHKRVSYREARLPAAGVMMVFYCLPDTVDPRGPKGDTR